MNSEQFRQIIVRDLEATSNRFRIRPDDGLLVSAIKCFGGPYQCWHRLLMKRVVPALGWLIGSSVIPVLATLAPLLGVAQNGADAAKFKTAFCSDPQFQRNAALDLYIFLWTVVLLFLFWGAHSSSESWASSTAARLSLISCAAISLWRWYEILIFLGALHSTAKYSTSAKMRAILNTLWHYGEATIIFAVLYVAAYGAFGDGFTSTKSSCFNECPLTPLYFSFVTITTLGYGDHSPQSWIGKVLVCLEVATGLFLFLVVLQRAISSSDEAQRIDSLQ